MVYFATSISLTILFYSCIAYMSYFTASILHKGIIYKLLITIIKSVVFIMLCYISIISDVLLFRSELYKTITMKNGFLLLLVTTSLISAKKGKEIENE